MKLSNQKIAQAATVYLERKGYEIRETDIDREYPLIVAADEFGLAFISCAAEIGDWPERTFTREEFEAAAVDYLLRHGDDVDISLRADEIDIQVLTEGHGLLRHHLDVPSVSRD